MQEASQGTRDVSSNIVGVTKAASETGAAAHQVTSSAGDLSKQSERLNREVREFFEKVRAA